MFKAYPKARDLQVNSHLDRRAIAPRTTGYGKPLARQPTADPSADRFTNVTAPCWTGDFTDRRSGTVCSDASQCLFWDKLHPTAAGHQLVATVALVALVPEPGSAAPLLAGLVGLALVRRRPHVCSPPEQRASGCRCWACWPTSPARRCGSRAAAGPQSHSLNLRVLP